MDIEGRVALVTGGAHRVGRALSLALAGAGADVLVHYHESAAAAAETVASIEALGRRALAVPADLADATQARGLVDAARTSFGRLDILVNSASTFQRTPLPDITTTEWDRVLAVNLRAPFLLAQAAAPLLRGAGDGVIVNLLDLSAFQAWPSYAHHSVSKAGLLQLTRVLARALAPAVRVNAIAPGTVLPPDDFDGTDNVSGRERRLVPHEGDAGAVVDAMLYLIRARFVTGSTLLVDGGRMLL